jgi:F-type H+-transporting ATPase subunit epsilon
LADDHKIRVEVLTPEGQVFDGEVAMVSTRSKTGSLGILANHAPLMAMLEPTELALYDNKDDGLNANRENAKRFAQAEGYLQVADNRVLVLVEEAIPPEQVDRGAIESKLDEAKRNAEEAEEDSEAKARFERDVRRYEAFLSVVGDS